MAGVLIVLDTHALLWWALDPERLSARATQEVERMEVGGGFVSSISLWELAIKVKRGHLDLPLPVDELARRLERGGVVHVLPVDTKTWLTSVSLDWPHRDPADRVIVATAMNKNLPLLTKDSMIQNFPEIVTVW